MRKWWKNYRYRFTPYVRGDLTKMKNARYADEGPLTSQAELCRQLNEVRRRHHYHHQIFTPFCHAQYLNFCHHSSGDLSTFMPRFGFRLAIRLLLRRNFKTLISSFNFNVDSLISPD